MEQAEFDRLRNALNSDEDMSDEDIGKLVRFMVTPVAQEYARKLSEETELERMWNLPHRPHTLGQRSNE